MPRRLIDITDDELLDRIKNLLPNSSERFEKKPPVTITWAAEYLGFASTKPIYDRIDAKAIKTIMHKGKRMIPFSELIRLDNAA